MLGSLGWQELLIVFAILALLFGARRIADIGGALGRGIREFREETRGTVPDATGRLDAPPAATTAGPVATPAPVVVPAAAPVEATPVPPATASAAEPGDPQAS